MSDGPTTKDRPSWPTYFLRLAAEVATRSSCVRKQVGAVLVRDNRILVTGYAGSMPGERHCTEVGCLIVDGSCKRTIHAEQNAVAQAASSGVSLKDATAYLTYSPCWECYKLLRAAGVTAIICQEAYWRPYPDPSLARNVWVMDSGHLVPFPNT